MTNLLDVDNVVNQFIKDHDAGITTIHKMYFHNSDTLSVLSLKAELFDELKNGYISLINKGTSEEEFDSYLFYIVNAYCKKKFSAQLKRKTEYICPGCLYLGKQTCIFLSNNVFECFECSANVKTTVDPSNLNFLQTFAKHNKNGYHCDDCDRFIPHPLDKSDSVICPYLDCCYVGTWESLKKMNHPTTFTNPEKLVLDSSKLNSFSFKDRLISQTVNADVKIEKEEELQNKLAILKDVIDSQMNSVLYSSSEFTVKHKTLCYQAYLNLLDEYPVEMVDYLLHNSRSGGFQQKIFQEYISLLEKSLPYSFKKNGKIYKVESLLDEQLNLFDGISTFEATVSDKLEVKNNTQEYYIGGRKAAYTKPYYIGKLLNVIDKNSKKSLLSNVEGYGFSKIKMKDIESKISVTVTHLRVPPHYQMGGMVYVNRLRKKIIEKADSILTKE